MVGILAGLVLNRILRSRRYGSSEPNELLSQKDPGMVGPYHSSMEESGDERSVFHDRSDCPAGSRIKPENRVSGTAGRSKCKDCQNIAPRFYLLTRGLTSRCGRVCQFRGVHRGRPWDSRERGGVPSVAAHRAENASWLYSAFYFLPASHWPGAECVIGERMR